MRRFEGRMAWVSGAGHGIGRAIAHRLATEGASVSVADRDRDAADNVAGEITASGGTALAVSCDVTDRASVEAGIAAHRQEFGGLDVLVNNAGGDWAPSDPFDEDYWHRVVELNLTGAMRCIAAAIPALLAAPHGNVVSIGSVNGLAAFGGFSYSAAKAGLENLTKNLAVEYGPQGLRFNLVAPGTIRTRVWANRPDTLDRLDTIYPLRRVGEPADIAAAVAYLASDDAAWVTGITLPVDGGIMAGPRTFLFRPDEKT